MAFVLRRLPTRCRRGLCRYFGRSSLQMHSRVQLQLLPPSCLFDEPVQVKVEGLAREQEVHLRATLTDDKGVVFASSALYKADLNGNVDLGTACSLGGTYTGIEPMGLFWSMQARTPHAKLRKTNALSPCVVNVEVCQPEQGQILAQQTAERAFMAEGTRRFAVQDGRLRGTLFVPPGQGPFPGVVDLYTLGGGLPELRGGLLANHGFVVLCLALYNYQDMPKTVDTLDLEYIEEAIVFLQSRPEVKGPGVGIISISKSGDLALSASSFLSGITATVCINGCNGNVLFPLHYKDMVIPPLHSDLRRIVKLPSGIMDIRDLLVDSTAEVNKDAVIPIERASCDFLFIAAENDRNWNSALFAEQAASRLRDNGKSNYEVVHYEKAGHFLEFPYMPHCPSSLHAAVGSVVAFGGEPKPHADAQLDMWKQVQRFLKERLNGESSPKAKL